MKKMIKLGLLIILIALAGNVVYGYAPYHTEQGVSWIKRKEGYGKTYVPLTVFEKLGYHKEETDTQITYQQEKEQFRFDKKEMRIYKNELPLYQNFVQKNKSYWIDETILEEITPYAFVQPRRLVKKTQIKDYFHRYRVVAHALGSVDGRAETCSLEAFLQSYQKGNRLFEVDLILTTDNQLVARHDWSAWLYGKFLQAPPVDGLVMNYENFKQTAIFRDYTPLSYVDLLDLMQKFPDVYLITDTKETESQQIIQQFQQIIQLAKERDETLLNRIIPQFYHEQMYEIIHEMHEFPSYIYTLYLTGNSPENIINFAVFNDITTLTMHYDRINDQFADVAEEEEIKIYVHTLNNMSQVKNYLPYKIHGIYSDFITEFDYQLENIHAFD